MSGYSNGMRSLFVLALGAIIIAAPVRADVKAGVDHWERGQYEAAVREWRPFAVGGDADAQFNMGQAYKLGRGVPADAKLAADWYRRAAKQGHERASDNYGLTLFQNGDRKAAMPYIEASAGRGDARAQYVLATALFNGDVVPKDWPRAYALMTRASAAGVPAAVSSLAQMDSYIPLDQRQRGQTLARQLAATMIKPRFADAGQPRTVAKATLPGLASVAPKPSTGGKWRIQLAAIDNASRAAGTFASYKTRILALAPYSLITEQAGVFTRIQAGPLASREAANALCAAVKAKGQACLPVAR